MGVGKDKIQHAGICFLLAVLLGFWSPWWGFLITCVVGALWGIAQKVFDFGQCDIQDFYADLIGAFVGLVLALLFFP